VYGTQGILYARYRCSDCECEWDDPSERPSGGHVIYRVKFDGKDTTVIRNGELLSRVIAFSATASLDSPLQRVTLTEYADVEPI
jgi:hypothetical protein